MNAHRTNYTPTPLRHRKPIPAGVWAIGVGVVFVLVSQACVILYVDAAPQAQLPAFGPEPGPITAQRLTEIRLEAFRAGMQSAQEGGCTPAHPLPGARP